MPSSVQIQLTTDKLVASLNVITSFPCELQFYHCMSKCLKEKQFGTGMMQFRQP